MVNVAVAGWEARITVAMCGTLLRLLCIENIPVHGKFCVSHYTGKYSVLLWVTFREARNTVQSGEWNVFLRGDSAPGARASARQGEHRSPWIGEAYRARRASDDDEQRRGVYE